MKTFTFKLFQRCKRGSNFRLSSETALVKSQALFSTDLPNLKTKHIKARFTRVDPEEKKHFPSSTGILYVSIPNVYCEGVYLEEILKLIDTHRFKLLKVVVCDVLQFRTRQLSRPNLSPKEIYNQLLLEGSQWIIRYASLLGSMRNTSVFLTKWSDHINANTPNFKTNLTKIQQDYTQDINYQLSLHDNVQNFIKRQQNIAVSDEAAFSLCRDYLIEEVAEYLQAMSESHYHIFVNKREEALSATAEKYGSHQFKPLAIRFKSTWEDEATFEEVIEDEQESVRTLSLN